MPSKVFLANAEFLRRVHEYLPTEALVQEIDGEDNPVGGNLSGHLQENTFYVFNGESLISLTHAIEDHALDEAQGTLLAAFEDFSYFDQNRDRYWQLAATLEDVEVIAAGARTPRRKGRLRFCDARRTPIKDFWAIFYEGMRTQIGLFCEKFTTAREIEQRQYIGFYTFDAALIRRARQDMVDLLGGRCPELKEFSRLRCLDRAAKQLKGQFVREHAALDTAIRRLRAGAPGYQANHFSRDFAKCIQRLREWEVRFPEMLSAPRHKHD